MDDCFYYVFWHLLHLNYHMGSLRGSIRAYQLPNWLLIRPVN